MNKVLRQTALAVCIVAGFMLAACHAERRVRMAPYAAHRQSGFTPAEEAVIAEECGTFGLPRKEWTFGHTDYVVRSQYVLEHHPVDRIPLWVAEHVRSGDWDGNAPRPNASHWHADDSLPADGRAELTDYAGSGYHRGHMAPNGDYGTWDDRVATFTLSNAVPQNASQNSGVWAQLEDEIRGLIRARGEGYIITGPMFYEAAEDPETGSGGDGVINYYVIGSNDVAVPTHTFKMVVVPTANGGWEGYGFVIANKSGQSAGNWSNHMKTIDWIERRTGFNFYPALTGADEAAVESRVRPSPFN